MGGHPHLVVDACLFLRIFLKGRQKQILCDLDGSKTIERDNVCVYDETPGACVIVSFGLG